MSPSGVGIQGRLELPGFLIGSTELIFEVWRYQVILGVEETLVLFLYLS